MSGFENTSDYGRIYLQDSTPPTSHLEGFDSSRLEGIAQAEKNLLIGEYHFEEEVASSPGLLEKYQQISPQGSKEEFASYYERYISDPHTLMEKQPELYEFFKDRIFYGREYGLDGMEAFLNRTAAEQPSNAEALENIIETSARLPRTEIHDVQIENCSQPFSYGNAAQMSEKLDFHKGDSGLLPIAPDRIVACRNLMALCGKPFTEGDVTMHAVDNEYMAYDPLYLKGFSHDLNELIMPDIIQGMSGIETHAIDLSELKNPAETIAAQLDHGYRGLIVYNSAILNRSTAQAGKLADHLPFQSANEASALECAVRDGKTGNVTGFYICDSTANHATRYVEADRVIRALSVRNGTILMTNKPYPED